jgi:hypothetical protein
MLRPSVAFCLGSTEEWQSFPHIHSIFARRGLVEPTLPQSPSSTSWASKSPRSRSIRTIRCEARRVLSPVIPANWRCWRHTAVTACRVGSSPRSPRQCRMRADADAVYSRARRGFYRFRRGALHPERILVPVDRNPASSEAITAVRRFCLALDARPTIRLHHAGTRPLAKFDNFPVDLRNGGQEDSANRGGDEGEADRHGASRPSSDA